VSAKADKHTVHKNAKFEYKEHEGMSVPALCKAIGEPTKKDLTFGNGVTCEELACGSVVIFLLAENQILNVYAAHVNEGGRS
jgi:hypothetical protein